jgi:hypothetical protein
MIANDITLGLRISVTNRTNQSEVLYTIPLSMPMENLYIQVSIYVNLIFSSPLPTL